MGGLRVTEARKKQMPGSARSDPGLHSPCSRLRRAPVAAAELVPPRLILGGVEQPKRRRRALDRGGGKKSQLPVAKPQTERSLGAAERPSAVENR